VGFFWKEEEKERREGRRERRKEGKREVGRDEGREKWKISFPLPIQASPSKSWFFAAYTLL
jgi:hypothetical protein